MDKSVDKLVDKLGGMRIGKMGRRGDYVDQMKEMKWMEKGEVR